MKRLSVLAIALVAALALGAIAAGAAVKVPSEVTIAFNPGGLYDPYYGGYYEESTLSGKVKPDAGGKLKKKCRKGRVVAIKPVGGGGFVAEDKTNKKGRYRVSAATLAPGDYFAKAKKKKTRVKGMKVVCKGAKSAPITIAAP